MKFKVDETVRGEGLEGATDDVVLATYDREGRVLVTEDLDFANVVAYPPDRQQGIVVMRTRQQGLGALAAFRRLVLANLGTSIVGRLWIVEDDRVRVHGGTQAP